MYRDPIVEDRIQMALAEGVESQSAARARRKPKRGYSLLCKVKQAFSNFWTKERRQLNSHSFDRRI